MARIPYRLEDLAQFAVFADSMSFSEAARQLHISQPALHVKIRKLGEQMGVTLYQRAGRELRLTAQGEVVARFGREMQGRAQALAQRLNTGESEEPLVFAAGTGAYMYLLGDAVQRFLRAEPGALQLLSLDRERALQALLAGRAQMAVAPMESMPRNLRGQLLARVGQSLILPRRHPLASKRRLRLQDLEGQALVVPRAGQPHRETLARSLRSTGVTWQLAVEADGWDLMMRFVQLGVGIAVVNRYCRPPSGLVSVPLPELASLDFYLLQHRDAVPSTRMERFGEILLESTAEWRNS